MKFQSVCIESFRHVMPDRVVSSEEIEERIAPIYDKLNLVPGRLELMTGVKERRFWQPGTPPSQVSHLAGARAIETAGIDPNLIGCVVHTSVCRDFLEPSTASVVHHKLGLPSSALVFDVTNACLGFLNGLVLVANMIELGQIKAGLVVSGECAETLIETTISQLLNDPDPSRKRLKALFPTLTIGSASAAAVLTHESLSKTGHHLRGGAFHNATEHYKLCQGSQDTGVAADKPMSMETDGETLMKEGCKLGRRTWETTKSILGWSNETLDRTFCHQVGKSHRRLLFESLDLDVARDFETLPYMGNTGSVSLPFTVSKAVSEGAIAPGQKAAMFGIGSGLNCLFLGMEW